jgi:diguanylate cyclase (GGDEF)-like protein
MADADWFKALNDTAGHLHGDECLRALARLCAAQLRDEGRPGRALRRRGIRAAAAGPRPGSGRVAVGEALRKAVARERLAHPASPIAPYVTVSIGAAATWPSEGGEPDGLLLAADRAMYAAKARGRNWRGGEVRGLTRFGWGMTSGPRTRGAGAHDAVIA